MPKTPKILVVEDSFELRVALDLSLKQEGYDVRLATDGTSFLDQLTRFDPDLVIVDLRLPGMSGADILREFRSRSTRPAIVFSAVETGSEIKSVIDAGVTDYVLKGTGVDELLRRIRTHLAVAKPAEADTRSGSEDDSKDGQLKQRAKATRRANILVCEPNSDRMAEIRDLVKSLGHNSVEATTESEPELLSGAMQIDFAVLDPAMTDRLGARLVQQISILRRDTPLGLIFLAPRVQPELRRRLGQCVVLDYIDKATQMWELPLRLRFAVDKQLGGEQKRKAG